MNLIPLILYAAAGIAYAIHFARRDAAVGRTATTLLLLGVLSHTFVIGMQTMEVRHVPFANPSRAVSTFVWLLTLSYLYLELTTDERAMGVFILPIIVGLQVIPVLSPGIENRDPVLDSPWFWVHVSSLLFAYASFGLAGVLGLTYVLQFKEIKKKHLGYFYTRLPSLQILDRMNSRATVTGWAFLTLGLIVGVVWTVEAKKLAPANSNLQDIGLYDPKVLFALLAWALYSFAVLARGAMGWTGRRAAWLSAVGFVVVQLNLVFISYFVETSHTFQ
ncbi:MAG TPA: cytochrome c biogenesis protein CcsA [Vicinamibacterales bacterium]|nr:cytochrome c biogenesis protein CcsA [Vicinamibacterales bacterium]